MIELWPMIDFLCVSNAFMFFLLTNHTLVMTIFHQIASFCCILQGFLCETSDKE